MPSISEPIVAGADDVHSFLFSTPSFSAQYFEAALDIIRAGNSVASTSNQWQQAGLRFTGLSIPQGATINSADLILKNHSVESLIIVPDLKWYADDVDDAQPWSENNAPRHIVKTTANVQADAVTTDPLTQDVKSIVQEVVNRAGWEADNAMRFVLTYGALFTTTAICRFFFSGYEAAPTGTKQAVLDVTYTEGGEPEPAPPRSGKLSLRLGLGI